MTAGAALFVGWLIAVQSHDQSGRPPLWGWPSILAAGLVVVGFVLIIAVMNDWWPFSFRKNQRTLDNLGPGDGRGAIDGTGYGYGGGDFSPASGSIHAGGGIRVGGDISATGDIEAGNRPTRPTSGSRSGSHTESSSGSESASASDPAMALDDQSQTAAEPPGPAVSASLKVTQSPREYPPDPPITPSQWELVLASKFSFKSQGPEFKIHLAESTVSVGMRFKNIASSLIRWEMERFQVSRNDLPPSTTLYLTTRGTLEPQETMVFGETTLPDFDPSIVIEGRLDFRSLYGPPQRPRAFWFEETWNFTITPLGDGKFETRYYKAREGEFKRSAQRWPHRSGRRLTPTGGSVGAWC
jgi:hypothetical protein